MEYQVVIAAHDKDGGIDGEEVVGVFGDPAEAFAAAGEAIAGVQVFPGSGVARWSVQVYEVEA